jgi:hypothetical protein
MVRTIAHRLQERTWRYEGQKIDELPKELEPVLAGPEAEFEELQKFKKSPDEPFNYRVLKARKLRSDEEKNGWWPPKVRRKKVK